MWIIKIPAVEHVATVVLSYDASAKPGDEKTLKVIDHVRDFTLMPYTSAQLRFLT